MKKSQVLVDLIDANPAPPMLIASEPLPLTEITVSVKVTIPLQQYGNIEMFVSEKLIVNNDIEIREHATIAGLNQLKWRIAQVVLPLAEAEVERGKPALMREASPDTWMQKNNSVYRWLRVAQPDMEIPAMEAIIMDEDRIAATSKPTR